MQLQRAREDLEAAGAELTFIGMASPRQAAWFRGRFAPDVTILADDERVSYKALGLDKGSVGDLIGPKSVLKGVRHAARSGVMQGKPVGNPSQLGGALVVAPGGEVRLEHRAQHAGDNVDPGALLDAVRG